MISPPRAVLNIPADELTGLQHGFLRYPERARKGHDSDLFSPIESLCCTI